MRVDPVFLCDSIVTTARDKYLSLHKHLDFEWIALPHLQHQQNKEKHKAWRIFDVHQKSNEYQAWFA